ncbi:hypothetical protein SBA3_1250037 [Candidatus Sulfopaludibacter sp. SbA3]|nr:hypothetical protein SBA3_1250037 [Candidatus Sulfopaludibacter sp. SbA3]
MPWPNEFHAQTTKIKLRAPANWARLEGEDKANMANRPDFSPDVPLAPEVLAELRHRYALLSPSSLQQVYADAWERCNLELNGRLPRAEQIQVLVTAWKALRAAK